MSRDTAGLSQIFHRGGDVTILSQDIRADIRPHHQRTGDTNIANTDTIKPSLQITPDSSDI